MLKVTPEQLDDFERRYPGLKEQILRFEAAKVPPCSTCKSFNTAEVQAGVIGRTILIATATTKFLLTPNGSTEGQYYCWECKKFFGERDRSLYVHRKGNVRAI